MTKHQSILTSEVVRYLQPKSGATYLDATFGGGGHSRALLEASSPAGRVVAVDRDASVGVFAKELNHEFGGRLSFHSISYTDVKTLEIQFDGAIFDLGLSSDQLEASGRGFSFQRPAEPLDLRFSPEGGQNAAEFLRQAPLSRLEYVFRTYAEDRYWRRLSRTIVQQRRTRPIRTVGDFISYVGTEDPKVLAPLMQALRIEVNSELETLKLGLKNAAATLKLGGRMAVISFHSLEDRIIKEFFRQNELEPITKKPVLPSEEEIRANPRSRSAKLRVAEKI